MYQNYFFSEIIRPIELKFHMKTPHSYRLTKIFSHKIFIFSCPSILTYVLGAQKNRLIETVLLSTHNICFG